MAPTVDSWNHEAEAVNAVFKALNDPSRRLLLDRLRDRDGQTLGELCAHLPSMTRYGVMNHLRVLADADLVTTVAAGRSKHHYLNPVPIRLIHDRWIVNYTEPLVSGLASLGATVTVHHQHKEQTMPVPSHRYQTYVRCTPNEAWTAITEGDSTVRYFYGTRVESTWVPGEPLRYLAPDGSVVADGEVIAADAPHRLEMTFHPRWDPALEREGPAHMAWIVDESDGLTRITVEYYDLAADSRQASNFMEGIPLIVAGLKTLLETGQPLASAAP
ncbi:MAG: helix-turn-helix domain-containing protein [Acidimicrobiia bacterium]|nr:helix-turn-helix domain-containing protein [Acidimicrobiia bacterium]